VLLDRLPNLQIDASVLRRRHKIVFSSTAMTTER
jgi:hypothetical protein